MMPCEKWRVLILSEGEKNAHFFVHVLLHEFLLLLEKIKTDVYMHCDSQLGLQVVC